MHFGEPGAGPHRKLVPWAWWIFNHLRPLGALPVAPVSTWLDLEQSVLTRPEQP